MSIDDLLKDFQQRRLDRLLQTALADLLVRKLGKEGWVVTRRHKRIIRAWLIRGKKGPLKLGRRKKGEDRELNFQISPREARRLQGKLRRSLSDDTAAAIQVALKKGTKPLVKELKRSWPSYAPTYERMIQRFEKRLALRWRKPLRLMALLLHLAREFGDEMNDHLRKATSKQSRPLIEVGTRLHARACQIASEVMVLLKAGYADGAMARWRSLHEVATVLLFICQHGSKTARRYLDHEIVGSLRSAKAYAEFSERLGDEPVADKEIQELEAAVAAMCNKYGANFRGDYGWAAIDLNMREQPSFGDIERKVGLGHWQPHCKLADHYVHAGPKGIMFRLSAMGQLDLLLTGPSNYGLADPGQNTAISLAQATAALGPLAPTLKHLMVLGVMNELLPEICEAFGRCQQRIEDEEESKRTPPGN